MKRSKTTFLGTSVLAMVAAASLGAGSAASQPARSAGLMTPGSDGRGELLLEGDANSAAAVGMTLEPAGGSTQPTTKLYSKAVPADETTALLDHVYPHA